MQQLLLVNDIPQETLLNAVQKGMKGIMGQKCTVYQTQEEEKV